MSHHDFVGFLEAVNTDPELSQRVDEIQDGTMDEKVTRIIELGRNSGFTFSEEEMDSLVLAHAANESDEELSPEALDTVAGGLALPAGVPELNRNFGLQYLALQESMQQENRQYTALTNIMKTKHDTAKAAINNVRG